MHTPSKNTSYLAPTIGLNEIAEMENRLTTVLDKVRDAMLAPESKKVAPLLNISQLSQLCGEEKSKIHYRIKKGDLPAGTLSESKAKRFWKVDEVHEWTAAYRAEKIRPRDKAPGVTIVVANFKGGVAKTTTAATLAQGLSLRGHSRVLCIDTDGQGSLTQLLGKSPTTVELDETILPLYQGSESSLDYAVRPTYWPGIDLVSASPIIFDAEFALPVRQMNETGFEFWSVLDEGLNSLREKYDVIIIDTPPSLSYSTINSLMAADGLVLPIPPNALDFASSAQFWRLFLDFAEPMKNNHGVNKHFSFINVLMTKVDNQESMSGEVRRWILSAYGDSVLPIEIPKTSIASTASAEFGTAYDISDSMSGSKTWKRAHDAYERMIDLVEDQIVAVWAYYTRESK